MNQLDQATQGNAASSEEVAASSDEMSSQAISLAGLVRELKALVDGKSDREEPQLMKPVSLTKSTSAKAPVKLVRKERKPSAEEVLPLGDDSSSSRKIGDVSGF
jgi:methyl-accepting chemotaxis protein